MMDRRTDWRAVLAESDGGSMVVGSMLEAATQDDLPAAQEAAGERLLIAAARAGNPLTPEQVARVRSAARARASSGGPEPVWRGLVEASASMLVAEPA